MKTLTDRGILWRTFPVVSRKRVKYDPKIPVEFPLFGSNGPVFKCLGGYFSHNSYNLFDFFVSYWHELAVRKWLELFREDHPLVFKKNHLENLIRFTPILRYEKEDLIKIRGRLPELFFHFQDYCQFEVSDLNMRSHPSLQRLSSKALYEVIKRTSNSKIKTIYPIRTLNANKRDGLFTWFYEMNLKENDPWSSFFSYEVIEEIKGKDGRVNERVYRFRFPNPLPILMIHNTICGAFWIMNPRVYELSPDAQLVYRYVIVAGSRLKYHRVDFIGHRLGWKEKQIKRLTAALGRILKELQESGLIDQFTQAEFRPNTYYHIELKSSRNKENQG